MNTNDVPVLTAEQAMSIQDALLMDVPALHALAAGRTVCARVRSVEEHRAEFEAYFKAGGYQYSDSNKANAFGWWLACARANGLVKP